MDKHHFTMMAAYNRWANSAIYDAAAELDGEEFTRDVSAFFKSMMGTLNHLLVTDRSWILRFTGMGEASAGLAAILYRAMSVPRSARELDDRRIADWIDSLDEAAFAGRFSYVTVTNPRVIS